MIEGSCLCGEVRYEAAEPAGSMANCHCETCRKAHGAAFSTIVPVKSAGFRWISGENLLSHFESSVGKRRWYCTKCGSQIISTRDAIPESLLLRAGCIDRGFDARPVAHCWVESVPPWNKISDDLPQFERGFPGAPVSAPREHASKQIDETDVE